MLFVAKYKIKHIGRKIYINVKLENTKLLSPKIDLRHTVILSAILSSVFSPIPLTFVSELIVGKGPYVSL